jgi:hypothetical protein
MLLNRLASALPHTGRPSGWRGRRLRLVAAAVPVTVFAALGTQAAPAFGDTPTSGTTTCTVGPITNQSSGSPGGLQLIAQDTTSGISNIISPFHINASRVFEEGGKGVTISPPTTSALSTSFTQTNVTEGSSGSLTVTNGAGQKTTCLGQFKMVQPGGRATSTGFSFPQDRNWLYIQNGTGAAAVSSVEVDVNGAAHFTVPLTPGQLYIQDLSPQLFTFPPLNTLDITATGPTGSSVEAVVFGVGPFVFGYPDE